MLKVIDVPGVGEEVKLDQLGRITIPVGYRRKMRLEEGNKVVILATDEGLIVKSKDDFDNQKIRIAEKIEKVFEEYLSRQKMRW